MKRPPINGTPGRVPSTPVIRHSALAFEHDGCIRQTNDALGNSRSLDTYSNGEHLPFMAETGTATGQYWKFTRRSRQIRQ